VFYILFESSVGYALFERRDVEVIGSQIDKVQEAWLEFGMFSRVCTITSFRPFPSPERALENMNHISEGILDTFLQEFLEQNINPPHQHILGVSESSLGSSIESKLQIPCVKDATVMELLRFIRHHFDSFLKRTVNTAEGEGLLLKTQLGLAHSYSRAKVKFNVNKSDNMIIQSISLLDQMDKDINTFAMRVREWYSWHFPELVKILNDNIQYARVARFLKNRADINDLHFVGLCDIVGDKEKSTIDFICRKEFNGI